MIKITFYDLSLENLGVQILTRILKNKGYGVNIVYEPTPGDPFNREPMYEDRLIDGVNKILSCNPDVVAFSTYTFNVNFYIQVAKRIKQFRKDVIILFGGVHATLTRETILTENVVDFSIIGEAEEAIIEFLEELDGDRNFGRVKNLCYRDQERIICNPVRPYISNLDSIPFPDKSEYYKKNPFLYVRYNIATSRGCPFKCTFCSNTPFHDLYAFERKHIRSRSPENVIEELLLVTRQYPVKCIHFVDEIFTARPRWLREFSKLYRSEINIPVECDTHPLLLNDESLNLLKEMNTKIITIGVQTGNETHRREILNRKETNLQIAETIQAVKEKNIKIAIDHIFGLPGETTATLKESVDLYSRWHPTYVTMNWLDYFPNTKIIESGLTHHNITPDDVTRINNGTHFFDWNSLTDKQRKEYCRFTILMNSIGFFPGHLVRFLLEKPFLIPPYHFVGYFIQVISRVVFNRKNWALDYLLIIAKEKTRNTFWKIRKKIANRDT